MDKHLQTSSEVIKVELLFLFFAIIATVLVLSPIVLQSDGFPYLISNAVAVFVFILFTRYIFFLRHSVFAWHKLSKKILFFLNIPLLLYLVDRFSNFLHYADTTGFIDLTTPLSSENFQSLISYIKNESVFFYSASILVTIIWMIRLIVSIWRVQNRNTV